MNERTTFSITLPREDALHLQEMAHDGGLLLSEMAASLLCEIAEDDRRAHETVAIFPGTAKLERDPAQPEESARAYRVVHDGMQITEDEIAENTLPESEVMDFITGLAAGGEHQCPKCGWASDQASRSFWRNLSAEKSVVAPFHGGDDDC